MSFSSCATMRASLALLGVSTHSTEGGIPPHVMNTTRASLSPFPLNRRGFTLVELLTVIAIVAILGGILIPIVGRVRDSARTTQCVSNLRQWGTAARLFANEHRGVIALYNNLSDDVYSQYFSQAYMIAPDGSRKKSQEVMSRCPSAISDSADPDFRNRNYAFGRPNGSRTYPNAYFGFAAGSGINGYLQAEAASPSTLVLMVDVQAAGTGMITVNDGNASFSQNVRTVQINTKSDLIRHNGAVNAVFLDGHVETLAVSKTDYSNPENTARMNRWFSLQ
jgi:prepilin-type N-terminal cleavage/methylation domain-containing protein/prepilin-type processing-associated H-X9-DG protein